MFKDRLVKVCWNDPQTIGGKWVPLKDVQDSRPMGIITYGIVVYEDDHLMNLVSSLTNDGDVDGDICLPKSLIVTVTELNEGIVHSFVHMPVNAVTSTIPGKD